MKTLPPSPRLHRVLLAQSLAGSHLGARQLALQLARRHRAEFLQLIVEDLALLRAASLPMAIEILRSSGEHRSLSSHDLQAAARAQSEELIRELRQHHEIRATVRRIQGHFPAAGAEQLEAGDVLVLARPSRGHWSRPPEDAPVLMIYDAQTDRDQLETLASDLLSHEERNHRLEILPRPERSLIAAALRQHQPALILASATPTLRRNPLLAELLELVDCPLILQA